MPYYKGPQHLGHDKMGPWPVRNQAAQQMNSGQSSFFCIYSHFPLLTLLPELCFMSDHHKSDAPKSSPNYLPHPIHGKIIFHETSPWCQKGYGLLPHYT